MADENQTTEYKVILTTNGLDQLENAIASGGNIVISSIGFGDGYGPDQDVTPYPTQQDLRHKVFEKQLTQAKVVEGTIRYSTVLLSSDPSGIFTEIGLYLNDGSLYAVANIPPLSHVHSDSGLVTETEITIVMVAENSEHITIELSSATYVSMEYGNTYYIRTDGNSQVLADVPFAGHKITNLGRGTEDTDAANVSQTKKIGEIFMFGGVHAPDYAVECQGQSYSQVGTMNDLYNEIGTIYGQGSGSLTFAVPKLDPPFPENPYIKYYIVYRH